MFIMDDFQKLIDFGNLYNSFQVSLKGKGKKKSAAKFNIMALEYLYVMKRQLINRTYTISPYSEFIVTEPKKRIIKSGSFKDKVLQHCLCDYVLLPKMKEIFIKDNYAGQIGKGTLFGLDRLSENLRSFYEQYGCDGYILKCDITKFFYLINHDLMKKTIRDYFEDESIRWVCDLFIDSVDGDGLPLGNQSSQVFALIYLNGLDLVIISGEAKGADLLGERYAKENGIEIKRFPAEWSKYGKRAGYLRNIQMLDFVLESECESALIAFWDGKSKGTKHMIENAKKVGLETHIFIKE